MTFKQLVFNIVIILAAFSLVGWTAGPKAWHHCTGQWNIGPVPLAELALPEEGEHGKYAELTQFDVVQNPFVAKVNVRRFDHFLMVRPNHADDLKELDDSVLLMCSGQKGAQGVAEQVESGVLVGKFFHQRYDKLDDKSQAAIEEQFPDFDPEQTPILRYACLYPLWLGLVLYGIMPAVMVGAIGHCIWYYLKWNRDEQKWTRLLHEDQADIYRANQKAMRLVGNIEHSDGALQQRRTDDSYDVPQSSLPIKKGPMGLGWNIALIVAAAGGYYGAMKVAESFFYTEWGAHVGVLAANLIMLAIPLGGLLLLTKFKVRDRLVGRNENPLTLETATYRESAFYRYHAKVLKDLGMVEIGDFHQTGGPSILTRTIFLSPNGNLLVELGVEQGLPFFVIESLINSDKFLETHSMVSRWGEIRSESKPHQRRSANHKDIMRALQSHDELVDEHTFSGSNREAKFTAENFGRFLSFPTSA